MSETAQALEAGDSTTLSEWLKRFDTIRQAGLNTHIRGPQAGPEGARLGRAVVSI